MSGKSIRTDERGAASVEFALMSVFFFFTIMAAMDVGSYFVKQNRLRQAVASASLAAFDARDAVAFNEMSTFVSRAAQTPAGLTVTTTCNHNLTTCANSNRTCACVSSSGTFSAAGSCGMACGGTGMSAGARSGYYVTITASYPYQPVLLPRGVLAGKSVVATATTRLQ